MLRIQRLKGLISKRYYSSSLTCLLSSISPIDRLMRVKPAITKDEDNDEYEEDEAFGDKYDIENESDPSFRIGKKLLKLARIPYRQFDPLPPWIDENRRNISSYRTAGQIRRCLQKWMVEYNRDIQKKFIIKPIGWRKEVMNPEKAVANVKVYGAEDTVAYINYHFPARYAIMKRVFTEITRISPSFKPNTIIDFGCGPGTSGAAAMDIWGNDLKKYTGIDMSRSMLDAAKVMIEGSNQSNDEYDDDENYKNYQKQNKRKDKYSRKDRVRDSNEIYEKDYTPPCKPDCILWDKSSEIIKRAEKTGERYNMAIASYTLSELSSDPTRRAATQMLFELLDVGGYLVIVEQGNPQGSHTVRSARKFILDTFNKTEGKDQEESIQMILPPPSSYNHENISAHVIAPCTHDRPCPLSSGTWCSFSQKVYSGIIRKASEEKYSYVIIQKTSKSGNNHSWILKQSSSIPVNPSNPTPLAVLKRFLDCHEKKIPNLIKDLVDEVDWEEYDPPLYRHEWGRILRSPIKNKGHITSDVCMPQGFIGRCTLSRGDVMHIPYLYAALRKSTWGGLFPVMDGDDVTKSALTKKSKKIIEKIQTEPIDTNNEYHYNKNKHMIDDNYDDYDDDENDDDYDDYDEEEDDDDYEDYKHDNDIEKLMKSKSSSKHKVKTLQEFITDDDDNYNNDDEDSNNSIINDKQNMMNTSTFDSNIPKIKNTPILEKVRGGRNRTRQSVLESHRNRRQT